LLDLADADKAEAMIFRFTCLAVAFGCIFGVAGAQVPAQSITPEQRLERQDELKRLEDTLQRSQAAQAVLAAEMARLRTDRALLNTDLVATSRRVRETEERAQGAQQRLDRLTLEEEALRRSLESRRGVIVEVLASLQRLGRKPPPAVLVRPEDMLQAIRTSMLLGTVIPELRQEAEVLAQDLATQIATRKAMAEERAQLGRETQQLQTERERIAALVATRQGQIDSNEARLADERQKIQILVRQSQTLRELITRMEAEIASSSRAAAAARAVPLPSVSPAQAAAQALAAGRDMARLQPKIAFADARGALSMPVNGPIVRVFGAPDGFGGRESGVTIETPKFALVTAPADGWVSFAGAYRSFGHVLIINAGGGYHLVLTGLEKTSVEPGQFVLQGEPVASMGEKATGALAAEPGKSNPVLLIEIRKDGVPIDPGPWWAKPDGEKVRG
jgi:murein hydrolase activator